jgi:hypothetical protein
MRVKIQEVPLHLRRRAANHLESIRGTPMAPGADTARIGDMACPVYRPDIKEVAYWEIEIKGLKQTRARGHEGRSSGLGFVLLSTGPHDVPIPHWSVEAEPPSYGLEGKVGKDKAARLVKIDTLAYAVEDQAGNYLSHLGQFPPRIEGTAISAKGAPSQGDVLAAPAATSADDRAPAELKLQRNERASHGVKLSAWSEWREAKAGFAKAYQPHIDALRMRAQGHWDIERSVEKFGEGIHEGQRLTVALLQPGTPSLAGDGQKFVKLVQLDRQPPAVSLEAGASGVKGEITFQLAIKYADGSSETLDYFIVPRGSPSNQRSVAPHLVAQTIGRT